MNTAAQYRKYAEQCDEMACQMPNYAVTFLKMAQAWRDVAMQAEQKGKSGKGEKDETDGSVHA